MTGAFVSPDFGIFPKNFNRIVKKLRSPFTNALRFVIIEETDHKDRDSMAMNMQMEGNLHQNFGQGSYGTASALPRKLLSLGALLVLCIALSVCRYRLLVTGNGSLLCSLLTAFSAVVMLLLALLSRRLFAPRLRHGLPSVTFGASFSAFLLVTAVVVSVYFSSFVPVAQRVSDVNPVVSLLMKALALLSAAYFLVSAAWMELPKRKSLHLLCSMAPILFCALRILNTFINNSTLPLAFSGGYRILGMIAMMLFFLNEGKLLTGAGKTSAYLFCGYVSVLFCAAYDLPVLLYGMKTGASGPDAVHSLLSVALTIYILTRLASLPVRRKKNG